MRLMRFLGVVACVVVALLAGSPARAQVAADHLEYVVTDGAIWVYDMDAGLQLVKHVPLAPTARSNVKGLTVSVPSATLFVSYGGDGGADGTGSILAYDLLADAVRWSRDYAHGVDSMTISPDGQRLYMPVGEASTSSFDWLVLDASTGDELGSLQGGRAPHNTVIGSSGNFIYLAGRQDRYLFVRNLADGSLVSKVGPFRDTTRPFTVNAAETLVFVTDTGFLGFEIGRVSDGQVIYTVPVDGFKSQSQFTTPSHGISLSPNERELYLVDTANAYVHVFDVSGLPDAAPKLAASIKLSHDFSGDEAGCGTGYCGHISWLQHSLDGRFVFVGDEGDVITTQNRQIVTNLAPLRDTRKMIEIDWLNGVPVAASGREGLGHGS